MWAFLIRRLVAGVITLVVIAILGFFIARFAPGSPFTNEKGVLPEVRQNLERSMGMDKPLAIQFINMMSGYLRGDLGVSFKIRDKSVNEIVLPALGNSVQLGIIAFLLAMSIGIPAGIIAAARQNKLPDHLSMSVSLVGICVPNFLIAPLMILLFFYILRWLPPTGWPEAFPPTLEELKFLIMPAIALSLVHIAYISRLMRAGMLDIMNKDYIRTARAKGLNEYGVFLKHGLKNAITPVLSYAGPMAAAIVTGSIVVEKIFNINGLGQHFVDSALQRDYTVVMATVLIYSSLIILFNFMVDLGYALLDARVRLT